MIVSLFPLLEGFLARLMMILVVVPSLVLVLLCRGRALLRTPCRVLVPLLTLSVWKLKPSTDLAGFRDLTGRSCTEACRVLDVADI